MTANMDGAAYSVAVQRPETENPRDPRCRLELQRICGTCAHFQGVLRPATGVSERALCARFTVQKHRLANAWGCHRWERKGVRNV